MKHVFYFAVALVMLLTGRSGFTMPDGFYLPDSIREMTVPYRSIQNLIVLPVLINDRVAVNLVVDTGCRNLVLFGKKFRKLLAPFTEKPIQFSGLGTGGPLTGLISLGNRVSIHRVLGEKIPIVVVPAKNTITDHIEIDGVIGYDIFFRFEIELDPQRQMITFRPAEHAGRPEGFETIPLRLVELRPVMDCHVTMQGHDTAWYEMMIDTGSSLGVLLKTTDRKKFKKNADKRIIGFGFNGNVWGYKTMANDLQLASFHLSDIATDIIESPWHNYASIGMHVLKDYVVVINYYQLYVGFRRLEAAA